MKRITALALAISLAAPMATAPIAAGAWNIKKTFERSKKPDCWGWAFTFGQSKKLKRGCHN